MKELLKVKVIQEVESNAFTKRTLTSSKHEGLASKSRNLPKSVTLKVNRVKF